MSTCIVFYSWHGNNEALATFLANRLQCGVVRIVERRRRTGLTILFDVLLRRLPAIQKIDKLFEVYDHVILCGPIWAGRLAAPLRSFLKEHGRQLRDYSFVTLCGYHRLEQRQ